MDDENRKPAGGGFDIGKFDFNTMVFELWNGKLPLFKVFWIYYFSVVVVLAALGGVLTFLGSVFALLKLIWAGFMVKPIWLAADAYKGEKHWSLLAKVAAVIIAVGTAADMLF